MSARLGAGAAALLLAAAPASAAPGAADTVDWSTGLVTAQGVGIADRRAPSPETARAAARRRSIEAGKQALRARIAALPWAGGGTVGSQAEAAHAGPAIDAAIDRAVVVDESPFTDGSWRVVVAVPIEALRAAIEGPREVAAGAAPAAVGTLVVDAKGLSLAPGVGLVVSDGTHALHTAVLWNNRDVARVAKASHAKATAVDGATLRVESLAGASDATLVVVTGVSK